MQEVEIQFSVFELCKTFAKAVDVWDFQAAFNGNRVSLDKYI